MLAFTVPNTLHLMISEQKSIQRELKKRQAELRQLIEQMKSDQLNKSKVCQKLESELENIGEKLREPQQR